MPKKPTADDAKIIMRLYDLRREPEMRKARAWYAGWWPRSADEIVQLMNAPANPQENAWFRQVNGYWDMAASFVVRGVLNEDLFVGQRRRDVVYSREIATVSEGSTAEGGCSSCF